MPPIHPQIPNRFAPSGLELDRFEQVLAGEDRVLLRVLGRYVGTSGAAALDAVLIADDGLNVYRHEPLPDLLAGKTDAPNWRAGFDVALDLLEDRRVAFAIETGEGILLDLPHPEEHYLTPLINAAPGFTTKKARRHLALVAGMLAAASVPMGIPAIAVTQNPSLTAAELELCQVDRPVAIEQGIHCPPAPPAPAQAPAPPAATDTAGAAQQAQDAQDAQEAKPPTPPAEVQPEPTEEPKPVDGETTEEGDAPVVSGNGQADDDQPKSKKRKRQRDSGSDRKADKDKDKKDERKSSTRGQSGTRGGNSNTGGTSTRPAPIRTRGGAPTRSNPSFFDALPGPANSTTSVPNFVIRKFRVPVFLLPIYQAAGIQYGVRWEYLAAINEIETDYGRNLNVSSAGALGWMQFMPETWKMYGTDANKDGKKDPYNPVDAIFAAARYLKAAGAPKDMRAAIFAYNRADWYVDSVVLSAKLIAGIPGDLVGSLTGLTEGRFPVAARARYADDLAEADVNKRVARGQNAANVIDSDDTRRGIDIYAKKGSAVVAVSDGVVKKIGTDSRGNRIVVLQDPYGNRFTYRGLGSVARMYPVPRDKTKPGDRKVETDDDPKPNRAASAGRQDTSDKTLRDLNDLAEKPKKARGANRRPVAKKRLFAHPARPNARKNGGEEQIARSASPTAEDAKWEVYNNYFTRGFGLNSRNAELRPLKKGSRVVASTVLGRVGTPTKGDSAHVQFEIRPAGRGAPSIDPKPILDGWKLLEATAIYRAKGRNVLRGEGDSISVGQILLLPKPMLEKRVLADNRIEIYPGGRNDIKTGQIDRRVLALLSYLAESGLRPTVTSLKAGRAGRLTSSGNVSQHVYGSAVDIARINGTPILGNQDPGGVTDQAVRRIMQLQGTMEPDQVISLLDLGGPTLAMDDHADHIHVGFRPLFGDNKKLGRQAMAVLKPGQWNDLIARLGKIENPRVPTKPSKYAIPVRGSAANRGE